MAITSISRMQQRRGVRADLPVSLSEGEFGWCLDTRQLFIGNSIGYGGNTEILTEETENTSIITTKYKAASISLAEAVTRPLGSKLNDFANIRDFGAIGNGTTDDTIAINNAIESLLENLGVVTTNSIIQRVSLYFPAGVYIISDSLLLYPYLTIIGDGIDKTIIRAKDSYSATYMAQTADGEGNTGSNIGSGTGLLPSKIVLENLTFDTNNQSINIANFVRYQSIRCQNVKFKGAYALGDGTSNTHKAVILQSIGTGISTYDAQFINCEFSNVSHGIFSNDPVLFTTNSKNRFFQCYRGISLGEVPSSGGPKYSAVNQCVFDSLYGSGIYYNGSNAGVSSSNNSFVSVGVLGSVSPILWGSSSTLCSSNGDMFDTANLPGVTDLSSNNLIITPQQISINTQISLSKILSISNANVSTSTLTGAVRVAGGVGIQGSVYVGGVVNVADVSSTTLNLNAIDRVAVTSSPLRVASITTATRNLLTPLNGDIIYNTTDNRFQGYQNGAWINLDNGTPA